MRYLIILLIFTSLSVSAKENSQLILDQLEIGNTEAYMMSTFGSHNFNSGGPDIERTHAYEVEGMKLKQVQSGLNINVYGVDNRSVGYFIFKQIRQSKIYSLIYVSTELNLKSVELAKKILIKRGYKKIENSNCWYGENGNALIIPPEPAVHDGYLFVLEASTKYLKRIDQSRDFLMRPQFNEYCPELK